MKTLRALFVHGDWARDRLMAEASRLDDEALDRPFEMGKGSLRRTLEHLWRAERFWLDRWLGDDRRIGDPEPGLTPAALRERFRATAAERGGLLGRLAEGDLPRRVDFPGGRGERREYALGAMMLHECNHGFHHRAQALNMLRHLGAEPPGVDYITMKADRGPGTGAGHDVATIREYFAGADRARARLDAAVCGLGGDVLDRPFEMGPGSIRRVLLHVRDAEQWWLECWTGGPPPGFRPLPATTSTGELGDLFAATARERNAFLRSLRDDDLDRTVTVRWRGGRELSFTVGDTMVQLCGHGTHHRAQALNMLRRCGIAPPELDLIARPDRAGAAGPPPGAGASPRTAPAPRAT